MKMTILRMDDVGASTKQFEVYSRIPFGNVLFLKHLPPFRAWGPYRELTAKEWHQILELLRSYGAHLTVGVTAAWVEGDGTLTPFPKKFPQAAATIREGLREGLLEVANHGLTHCVVGQHRPQLFASNRKFHREFWPWVPKETHEQHLRESQTTLQEFFGVQAVTFIPPGSVWTPDTERSASAHGIRYLASREELAPSGRRSNGLTYVGDENEVDFHDRELVRKGLGWLEKRLEELKERGARGVTVQECMEVYGT